MTTADSEIRAYGAGKRFRAATIARWLSCRPADREATYRVVEHLRLGENQVRDLLDTLDAIALRHGSTPADVLSTDPVPQVLAAGRGRNETIHALKAALRRLRYPQLAEAETRLQGLIKELHLPVGVSVTLPDNLEGEEVEVRVRAVSAADLRRRMVAATEAIAGDTVDEMFRVLGGEW